VKVSPVSGSADPTPEMLHTRPAQDGGLMTGFGATLPAGSAMVTVRVVVPVRPYSSRTVRVTVKVLAVV
jgi:hypothetical protein